MKRLDKNSSRIGLKRRSLGLSVRWILCLGLFLTFPLTTHAAPVLDGDVDNLFLVDAAEDCPSCSAHELDQLQDGLQYALRRLRREALNPKGEICVAEASFVRELGVLTFDQAFRAGHISINRWRQLLKSKAEISGGLSPQTREAAIQSYLEGLKADGKIATPADYRLSRIFAAVQLSRLFNEIGDGYWSKGSWWAALQSGPDGANPVIDRLLSTESSERQELTRRLLTLPFDEIWREGQLGHLSVLKADFVQGNVAVELEQMVEEYRTALTDFPATTFAAGCAAEASAGFLRQAMEESQGLTVVILPEVSFEYAASSSDPQDTKLDDHQHSQCFGEEITIIDDHIPPWGLPFSWQPGRQRTTIGPPHPGEGGGGHSNHGAGGEPVSPGEPCPEGQIQARPGILLPPGCYKPPVDPEKIRDWIEEGGKWGYNKFCELSCSVFDEVKFKTTIPVSFGNPPLFKHEFTFSGTVCDCSEFEDP